MRFRRIKFDFIQIIKIKVQSTKTSPMSVTQLIIRTGTTTTLNSFAKVGLCEER